MSFFISDAFAEGAATTAQQPDPLASLILPIGLVVLFYFFLIRPQSKRQKEHRQMVADLQKGEEVLTSGGILGKITDINDDFVTLEISKGVEINMRDLVLYELEIAGSRASAGEMRRVMPHVADGRMRLSEVMTHEFSLVDYADALSTFRDPDSGALKIIITP